MIFGKNMPTDIVYANFTGRTGNNISVLLRCLYEIEHGMKKQLKFLNKPYCFNLYSDTIFSLFKNVEILNDSRYLISQEDIRNFGQKYSYTMSSADINYLGNKYFACKSVENNIKQVYPSINEKTSIHLRFGDYLFLSKYINLTKNYYLNAISTLLKETKQHEFFLVVSDDIDKAKEMLNDISNIEFFDRNRFSAYNDIYDFYAMRLCRHNIVANSTFSRYAALFNIHQSYCIVQPNAYTNVELKYKKLMPILKKVSYHYDY